jgi:hypothetical protein
VLAGTAAMDPFREKAFYLLLWRAILAAVAAVVLMFTESFELTAAVLIGANMALLFSLGLIAWTDMLSEERIVRTEAWRTLPSNQRPVGVAGRRWARNCLKETGLRFAEAASAIAIALSASALVLASG